MDTLASHLCQQVEFLQGLCRTVGIFAYAEESLEGLSVKDIGNTALLMGQSLDRIHRGLEKIEDMASSARCALTAS